MPSQILIPMLFYYPDRPSGSVRLAFDEAVYLAEQGHKVWVVTQDPTGNQPEYAFRDGLHVLQYPSPNMGLFNPKRMQIHQMITRDLLSRHIKTPVDLVHGHSLLHYDGALAVYGNHARCVYSVHSPAKLEVQVANRGSNLIQRVKNSITAQMAHRIERRCLENSTAITSDSYYTRNMLSKLHNPEIGARIQVVPGWVDTNRFQVAPDREKLKQRFNWPLDKPLLFTLRRLVPRNGIDQLLYALKIVKDAGHRFHIVIGGKGPLQDQLERLTSSLNLDDHVQFLGFVDDEDLPLMYAAADVFVLPTSTLECFGLITLEAFATGRPVLATPVAAIPEVLEQVEPAWLARDASPQAIAELIMAYLGGHLPEHAPDELRRFVIEHYDSKRIIPQLADIALGTLKDTVH
jgi:glycosyltransferase involved in cell wall biosynthesis